MDPINALSYKQKGESAHAGNGNKDGAVPEEKWRRNYLSPANCEPSSDKHHQAQTVDPVGDELQDEEEIERGQWSNKLEFIFSCVGFSVGIGNVWRFPYLAYENGGGAFLFPYFILLVLIGKPLYLMETAIGQYAQLGPLSVWKMAPIMRGVGVGMVVISLIVAIYYNVIMAYTLFFMFASFASEVPWARCNEWWGADDKCFVRDTNTTLLPHCSKLEDKNITDFIPEVNCTLIKKQTAPEQYWEKYVLKISDGLTEPGQIGEIQWDLALCLLLSWLIVFLCLVKGIKSSGKVVYFSATFPYVILITLLVRGVTLDGAIHGIRYFFIPEWHKLLDIKVWQKAAEQMFFSLGISWGALVMFGSYNKFHNKVHIDALVISSLDFLTSIIASVVIFSVLGAMAQELGINVDEVVKGGQGLTFIAYPEAIARLPISQLWAVLFFFMLFTLGLDSEFALLETFLTALYDEFPKTRARKTLLTGVCCACCYLVGLPCVSNAGSYILHLMDTFGGGTGVLVLAIFEMIGIMWVYGVRRFCDDIQFMLGFRPNIYWKVCWAFIAPVVLSAIFIYSMTQFENPKYGDVEFPDWAIYIGWFLAAISVCQIPLWAVVVLFYYICKGRPIGAFKPEPSWGPGDKEARKQLMLAQSQFSMNEMKYSYDNPGMDVHKY